MQAGPGTFIPPMLCCQCHQPMQGYWQLGTIDDEAGYFVTCVTGWCVMWGHTLAAAHYPPENLAAYLIPYKSCTALHVYLRLVGQESRKGAAAVEQIQYRFGAPAALRAALCLTIFRMEVREKHWQPDLGVYAHLMRDYPAATPWLIDAMHCCLQNWSSAERDLVEMDLDLLSQPFLVSQRSFTKQ